MLVPVQLVHGPPSKRCCVADARFISGCFNGDPHPGNVLVSTAESVIEFETAHGDLESAVAIPGAGVRGVRVWKQVTPCGSLLFVC